MELIKGIEQYPDLGVKTVCPSIDGDSEATDSDKEETPEIWSSKGPPEGISSIVWLGGPSIGEMGIIWTY